MQVLAPIDADAAGLTMCTQRGTGTRQILAPDVLRLLRARLPETAVCLLAVTMEDLYPDPTWIAGRLAKMRSDARR